MKKSVYIKIAEVERNHWWYRNLHHLVLDTIKNSFDGRDIAIIDAGCGTGGLLLFLKDKEYSNVMGFDISCDAVDICRAKGLNVVQYDLSRIYELYPHDHADVIISNDTFCFFDMEWCAKIIKQCYQVLKPNGLLILNLPACNAFRGIHDISVGIKHRFTKNDICILFSNRKFNIIKTVYWPFLLSPVIYLERLRQRIKMRINEKRLAVWKTYCHGLKPLADAGLLKRPFIQDERVHNANMFYIILPTGEQSDVLMAYHKKQGIHSVFHYIPLHTSPMGQKLSKKVVRLKLWLSSCCAYPAFINLQLKRSMRSSDR